jgi:biotin carboxyl carrier protein
MPGKILAVHAAVGETVARGAVLIVLEAMKMENDLLAPADGRVKSVHVRSGDAVNTGDLLVVLQ